MRIRQINKAGQAMLALLFASGVLVLNVRAQAGEEPENYWQIDSYARYMPSRSTDSVSGKVGILESAAEYSYGFKLFEKIPMKFSVDTQNIDIEDSLDSFELPSHLTGISMGLETTLPFFSLDKTYQRFGFTPSFYGDDFQLHSSGFRLPMYYFIIHRPDEKWTFLIGLAVYPDYQRQVMPILGFIYKPNDRLTFNFVPKRPSVTYLLNEKTTLFVEGGGGLNSEFEVDRDNCENVVLRYKGMRLGGGAKFKIHPAIETSLSAGAVFGRSFRYRDTHDKINLKDGVYTEFRLEIRP